MPQIYIIAGILCLISLLVCYVFIRQTVVKKQKEKARLHRALVKRAKFLTQMIEGFPPNFLTIDLSTLLLRNIVDTFEQLTQLMPQDTQYIDQFKRYTQMMEEAIKNGKKAEEKTQASIDSTSQLSELKQALNQLGRFIHSCSQRGNISQNQYDLFKVQIKTLGGQLMVDNYMISANQAIETDKLKLGIHYYTLAKNLITEEGLTTVKRKQLMQIEEKLPQLQATLDSDNQQREQDTMAKAAGTGGAGNTGENQWTELEEDGDWKKKNMYD